MSSLALVKRSLGTLVGLVGTSIGLTWLFLGMRSVMDVGGSCGSGGPYVIATPCPHGIPLAMVGGIFGGLISLFIYAMLGLKVGPRLTLLAWPALFLSLGYNFLQYGLRDGPEIGFLISGVIFILMGGTPLLLLVKPKTFAAVFWSDGPPPITPTAMRVAGGGPFPERSRGDETTAADADSIVVALERLTSLRDRGAITEAEFTRAKARMLDEEIP